MTNHEAEARPRRFTDQRGIALQTVIIMVVLLAIAGGVAAVLFSRANEATTQLDETEISQIKYEDIKSYSLCISSGGRASDASAGNPYNAADGQQDFTNCLKPA